MKIGVISDIHSNKASLKKALNFFRSKGIKRIYCLGDIIGYGDHPNEVIEMLRKERVICIAGNHERMLLGGNRSEKYNMRYTRKVITDSSVEYLKGLPGFIELKRYKAILSHAVPFTKDRYYYANSDFSVFDKVDYRIIFLGHAHYPMFMSYYNKKIINPGSVGQPRDGNKKAALLVCDLDKGRFDFVRI